MTARKKSNISIIPRTIKEYLKLWEHPPPKLNVLAKFLSNPDTQCPRNGNGKGKPIVEPVPIFYKG